MRFDRSSAARSLGMFDIFAAFGFILLWLFLVRELNYEAFKDGQEPEPGILWNSISGALFIIAAGLFSTGILAIRQSNFLFIRILSIVVAVLALPFMFFGWIWTFAGIAGFLLGSANFALNANSKTIRTSVST